MRGERRKTAVNGREQVGEEKRKEVRGTKRC